MPPPQAPRRTLEERLGGTGRRKSLAWTNTGCDDRGYDVGEPERSDHQRPRRNSYYAPHTPSPRPPPANYQDKLNSAERYQRSVGGPTVEVTAESLKESDRRARSHITRSRASRDGSENLRSSVTSRTTRTTGTGASEENVTIKLKGEGTIKIAGAEIEYKDDTELHIQRGFNVDSGVG